MTTRRILTTFAISLLAFGTTLSMTDDAYAGVGDTIRASKKSGKRSHKLQKRAKTSRSNSKSKSNTSRSTKKTRSSKSTTARKVSTRTVSSSPKTATRTRTTRTKTTRRSSPTRRTTTTRTTRRSGHSHTTHRRSTHTHHRSHGHSHGSTYTSAEQHSAPRRKAKMDGYLRGGLGMQALAAPAITDEALPGIGYEVALGAKGKLFGAELGFNGGNYTLDSETEGSELQTLGLSLDFKVQPKIKIFEPYAMIGVGGYYLGDTVLDEAAGAGALRLGFGADLRFDNIAVGARYVWSAYEFSNDQSYIDGVAAKTEMIGLNLAFYF